MIIIIGIIIIMFVVIIISKFIVILRGRKLIPQTEAWLLGFGAVFQGFPLWVQGLGIRIEGLGFIKGLGLSFIRAVLERVLFSVWLGDVHAVASARQTDRPPNWYTPEPNPVLCHASPLYNFRITRPEVINFQYDSLCGTSSEDLAAIGTI